MKNKILRNFILFIIFGFIYTNIELMYRNRTDVRMILVGGICGLGIGLINEFFPKMALYKQALIGALFTLIIEFIFGYIFNIILGLNIWDYSQLPFNIMGQVCLPFGVVWYLISFPCIYLDDYLRNKL